MTSLGAIGRRERKKLETRRSLRDNALRLFAERGFEGTTVEAITEAADVARRTFFLHYASKEDVLLADARERLTIFEAAVAGQPGELSPFEAVRRALHQLIEGDDLDDDELMLQARLMEEAPSVLARNLEHYTALEEIISRDAAQRLGQDPARDTYPILLAAAAMVALRVAVTVWYRHGGEVDLGRLLDDALDQLAEGLATTIPACSSAGSSEGPSDDRRE